MLDDPDAKNVEVTIVSRDKDLEQLLCDRVAMLDLHKDTIIDVQSLWETKGIKPSQVIDVLALMGDTSDNVPGVEKIGLKTAAQLIGEYGSVDGIFDNIDKIKGKRREKFGEGTFANCPGATTCDVEERCDFRLFVRAGSCQTA